MMRNLLLIFFSLFTFTTLAQDEQTQSKPRTLLDPPASQDRFIVELHNDMFLDSPEGMDVRGWSPGFNAYVMYDYPFGESPVSFAWGYGFSSFNVHLNGNFVRDTTSVAEFVEFMPFDENYDYDKHKISANFIEVPLEFRLRTRGSSPFKISVGGKVGYLVNIHTKTIDDDGKRKFYQIPEINRLRYGLVGRIGVGRFSAYGFYALSTFLNDGKGVELTPITLGISIALL
jgi:hypothetical protein